MPFANPAQPYVVNVTALAGEATKITFPSAAVFVQIMSLSGDLVEVGLTGTNGVETEETFPLVEGSTQTFNYTDLILTSITIHNAASGAVDTDICVIAGVVQ